MAKKRRLPAQDAMFLWGESSETMMHVGGLLPFTPPEGAGATYLRDLLDHARSAEVKPPFNQKLVHAHVLNHPLQAWVPDEKFDIDYHVRRSALASPGDERELGVLVSRLHSHQLDFTRPPWELHVIEGLEGGRFAIYVKVHHALVDGFTAVQMLARSLSKDPAEETPRFFFSLDAPSKPKPPKESASVLEMLTGSITGTAMGLVGAAGGVRDLAKAVATLEFGRRDRPGLVNPWSAPDTILNRRTSRTRRFATQQYETERIRRIAKASGGTINDVVMAICGGGLRRYLIEQDALPDKPLVAFMPVNIRDEGDKGGGNQVGVLLASMATDVEDPVQQLKAVIKSTKQGKQNMRGMGQLPTLAYSGYLLAPGAAQTLAAMLGVRNPLPTAFNVVLSNVPGPKQSLYLAGSRLEAVFPVSIPVHGLALNITLETYVDTMNFGFIGDRDAVPHLQRLAVATGEALADLEAALQLPELRYPGTNRAAREPDAASVSQTTRSALTAKKSAAKKSAAKKSAAKKPAAKKSAAKKSAAKKPAGKKSDS